VTDHEAAFLFACGWGRVSDPFATTHDTWRDPSGGADCPRWRALEIAMRDAKEARRANTVTADDIPALVAELRMLEHQLLRVAGWREVDAPDHASGTAWEHPQHPGRHPRWHAIHLAAGGAR
jgi:hypothetical protein